MIGIKEKLLQANEYLVEIKQELKHANSNRKPTVRNKIITQKAVIKSLKKELKKEIENI